MVMEVENPPDSGNETSTLHNAHYRHMGEQPGRAARTTCVPCHDRCRMPAIMLQDMSGAEAHDMNPGTRLAAGAERLSEFVWAPHLSCRQPLTAVTLFSSFLHSHQI